MTLGGLALAVGILVDDATVTIENIERVLEEGRSLHDGILEGAAQIAVPALVSTLCICIVFLPMFLLDGVARYLFVLMGALMCMGIATANSILVVSFAKERLGEHGDSVRAAIESGATRFRPVVMTALAMIIGMVPMALGLGEGGEQNAPLGRAVIGGLMAATVATLLFVPAVFSLLHRGAANTDSGVAHQPDGFTNA